MIVALDLLLFLVLIATAILALTTKDLLTAVALLATYSLFTALLFAGVSAVDVALVEAALGAGLTGVLFIAAILATTRHSSPRLEVRRRYVVTPLILAFLALMLYASTGLPDRGDPLAPAQTGIAVAYLTGSLEQTQTPNVVTSLLADYRSMDTLGETLVILTASLSAALVLIRRRPEADGSPEGDPHGHDDAGSHGPGHPATGAAAPASAADLSGERPGLSDPPTPPPEEHR